VSAIAPLVLFRSVLGLAFLFAILWLSYLLVRRSLTPSRVSSHWMAALLVGLLLLHVLALVLGGLHGVGLDLFRPWVALPTVALLVVLAHRRLDGAGARLALREQMAQAYEATRECTSSWIHRLLVLGAAVAAAARALAGIVSPPLTWDTLTYHAVKSAEWVQYGYQIRTRAPDAWAYYAFFPDAAEVPGAWAMLFLQGDLGLPFVGIGLWTACGFATYALARALGAFRKQAFRAALVMAFMPALLGEMVTGYADMFVLFLFLALCLALVLVCGHRKWGETVLLGAAAGLLASAKWSGVPMAVLTTGFVLVAPGLADASLSRLRASLLAATVALALAAPHYLSVLRDSGSLFYPYAIALGQHVLSAGNPQLHALFTGQLGVTDPRWASPIVMLQALILPYSLPKVEFVGFGPAFLLLVPIGCWGLGAVIARRSADARGRALPGAALLLLGLLPALGLLSKDYAGERAIWLPNLGRLLLPLPAALAALATCLRHRAASVCLILAVLMTLPLAWPAGVGDPMLDAIGSLAPWLALALSAGTALALAFALHPVLKAKRELAIPAVVGLAALTLAMPLAKIRHDSRYPIYEAAAAPVPAFIMQFTWPRHAAAWPLWQALDDGSPHRIHASFGWDGLGHNSLRYPLFGSQLQNQILYVPITRDPPAIIDYQDWKRLAQVVDETAWIARLRAGKIDRIFFGDPPPPEAAIVLRHPESFQLLGRGPGNLHALYRFIP